MCKEGCASTSALTVLEHIEVLIYGVNNHWSHHNIYFTRVGGRGRIELSKEKEKMASQMCELRGYLFHIDWGKSKALERHIVINNHQLLRGPSRE